MPLNTMVAIIMRPSTLGHIVYVSSTAAHITYEALVRPRDSIFWRCSLTDDFMELVISRILTGTREKERETDGAETEPDKQSD